MYFLVLFLSAHLSYGSASTGLEADAVKATAIDNSTLEITYSLRSMSNSLIGSLSSFVSGIEFNKRLRYFLNHHSCRLAMDKASVDSVRFETEPVNQTESECIKTSNPLGMPVAICRSDITVLCYDLPELIMTAYESDALKAFIGMRESGSSFVASVRSEE